MSEFDPYLKWLGIRETTRPINHYRLLGLELFESDSDVISMAADRQMSHIRTYQNGPHGEVSQEMLNELARARRCLLVAEQKAEYDEELRSAQLSHGDALDSEILSQGQPSVATGLPNEVPQVVPVGGFKVRADPDARAKVKGREKKEMIWGLVGWISGGVAAVGVSAFLIGSGILPMGGDRGGGNQIADNDFQSDGDLAASKPVVPNVSANSRIPAVGPSPVSSNRPKPNDPKVVDSTKANPKANPNPRLKTGGPNTPPAELAVTKGPLMPKSTRWTLGNSSEYPLDNSTLKPMFDKIAADLRADKTVQGSPSNSGPKQTFYQDIPEQASILVGFRVWLNPGALVAAMQPIYITESGVTAGQRHGKETKYYADVIAKPGYAVSAVRASTSSPMRSVALEFAKLTPAGFDLKDKYLSERFGPEGPIVDLKSARQGDPMIGVQIGLSRFPKMKPQELVASFSAFSPAQSVALAVEGEPDPFEPDAPNAKPTGVGKAPETVDGRTAIPSTLEQTNAMDDFKRTYLTEFQRISQLKNVVNRRRECVRLSGRFLNDANSKRGSAMAYVLLGQSMQMAASAGDATLVIDRVRLLNDQFAINFWDEAKAGLGLTLPNVAVNQQVAFKEVIDQLIVEAAEAREFQVAKGFITSATKMAVGNPPLRAWYKQQQEDLTELRRLIDDYEKAKETLAKTADDSKANRAAGDFLFLFSDQLEPVLGHWAKSGVSSYEKLVEIEKSTNRKEVDSMLKLSEAWHRVGRGKPTLKRTKALVRAFGLYDKTVRMLEGSKREKVEAVKDEIEAAINSQGNLFQVVD